MASGLLSLKWNNHRSTFFHILSTVRTKETYADVSLACEGKLYPVHKLVLSTCSEYFEEMFSHVDCKHPIIVLKDIKGDELEALLNYMYIGEVNVMQDNLAGLIKAAECLKIKGLAVPDEAPEPTRDSKRNIRRIEESPQPKRRRREEQEDITENSRLLPSASSDHKSSYREPRVSDSSNSRHVNSSENSVSRPNKTITPQKDTSREKDRDLIRSNDSEINNTNPKIEALPQRDLEQNTIDQTTVKPEPIDLEAEEDDKEMLQQSLGFDPESDMGSEEAAAYLDSQMVDEGSMPGSSGYQPGSFYMWEGEGGPLDGGYSENDPQTQQMVLKGRNQHQETTMEICEMRKRQQISPQCNYLQAYGKPEPKYHNSGNSVQQNNENTPKKKPIFNCPYCPREFYFKSKYDRHVIIHTGDKPFSCPYCDHRTARLENLKIHIAYKHTNKSQDPY